jgi:YbbR domain-containing protein
MWHWLRRHIFNNARIKLLALVLAMALYMLVYASQVREIVREVPLDLYGVPEALIWSGEIPDVAQVRLRGLGLDLLLLRHHPQGARLLIEVDDAQPGRYQRPLVTEDVNVPIEIDVTVVEVVEPREILLEFDRRLTRKLGVVPTVTGRPAPGFIRFGRVGLEPESVFVRGPERRLQSFEYLRTETVDITGTDENVIRRAALRCPPACEAVPPQVTVEVAVERIISRTFADLPVTVRLTGDVRLVRQTPEVGSVVVAGPATLVESLTAQDLRLSIDALGLPRGTYTLMASVELTRSLEAGAVSVEPVEPEKFEVELD